MNQIDAIKKALSEGSKQVDPEVALADQRNKLHKLVPEYNDPEVFEAERQVLIQRAVDRGMTPQQIAKLSANEVKSMRDSALREAENKRLDRIIENGRKAGRQADQLAADLLRGVLK